MLLCVILVLAGLPCTDQLLTQTDHALSEGLIQKGSNTDLIQYRRSSTSDSGSDKSTTGWAPLTFVAAQSLDELPTPSKPVLTFINISSVNISWNFNFSVVDPARNVCFGIEYQNNTRVTNVSSMICTRNNNFYIFPWLLRGQRYRFKVFATDGVTTTMSDWSFEFIDGIEAPPGPPQNFEAKVFSDREIYLTWNALKLPTPVAYEICYNALTPVCVGGPSIIEIGTNIFHLLKGLQPATVYYFEIRASVGPFNSTWSDWINVTTHSSTLSEGLIQKGSSTDLIQYRRSSTSDSGSDKSTTGWAPLTFVAEQSSDELPTPSMPVLTFINISSVNISWNFDFSVVGQARNVCFGIEYRNNTRYANVSSMICTRNHNFYIFPWLLRGQRYRFKVIATDGETTTMSDWSFEFINGIEAPPGPPHNFRAQVVNDTAINLSWDLIYGLPVSPSYEICWNALTPVCVDGPTILEVGNNHPLVTLRQATVYYFEIKASVGVFDSIWSDWISATTYSSTLPVVVINKQLTKAYSTAIYIQWIPIQQEKLQYIFREYCVDIVTGKLEPHVACNYTTTISNTSINITGLQPSTDYHIAVSYSATDNKDKHVIWSAPSDILNVKTRSLYHAPIVHCNQCIALSEDSLQISWKITSDDDHVTTSYVIFSKSNNGDYTWIRNVSLGVNVFNITGLHPNRGYAFAVQPLGDVINGSKADCPEDSCRTEQAVPDPPRNVRISLLSSTSVVVSWDDPGENNGVIDRFIVHYFCADRNRCLDGQLKTAEHNCTITGLYPYTNYTIVISAHTNAGDGQDSEPLTITTLEAAPDEEPQKITLVLPLPTSLYLKWSPPALKHQNGKIIGYKVLWRLSQGQDSPSLLGIKNVTKTFVIIVNLNLSTSYEVHVAAFTAKGIGPYANIIVTTLNSQYNLAFSSTLVTSSTSKNCQDIKLHWNPLQASNISYVVMVLPLEDEENVTEWNVTTQNSSVIVPRDQLEVGMTYEAELQVVVKNADPSLPTDIITRQLLNITLPGCSKPKDSTVLWSCVGGGTALVLLVLACVCCAVCCHRRRRHKLLQQLRKPVGGASSLIEEAEEVALLGQTAGLGSSTSSSNDSIDAGVQMIVKAEALDTPTDDTSSSLEDDISCMERPTPLGAEDS